MRIMKTAVYPFDELEDDIKQKVVADLWTINVDFEWWDHIYEDAEQAGLKLTEFELDRGAYCRGEFIEDAETTADAIVANHGENCETRQTAEEFIMDSVKLLQKWPVKLDDDGYDDNEHDRDKEQEEVDSEFLKSILEDYRIILQKDYEYRTSEEVIIEMIEANEFEFTIDGKLV